MEIYKGINYCSTQVFIFQNISFYEQLKLLAVTRRCFFCGSFLLFMFHVCHCYAVLSVPCSLENTWCERDDPLALLCVAFSCIFVSFPYGVSGQV